MEKKDRPQGPEFTNFRKAIYAPVIVRYTDL
jgi:hypothetical protein